MKRTPEKGEIFEYQIRSFADRRGLKSFDFAPHLNSLKILIQYRHVFVYKEKQKFHASILSLIHAKCSSDFHFSSVKKE